MGDRPEQAGDVADAGRIIAGTARGIRLEAPGPATRPLSDRVKETLFAILEPDMTGAHVLDLFAGSGAAGLEALSRGAAHVTFVEMDKGAAAVIASNLATDPPRRSSGRGSSDRRLSPGCVDRMAPTAGPFGIVLADPPYAETELLVATLAALGSPEARLIPGARVVAKHFWRDAPPARVGLLASERDRRFGETMLTFYRRQEDR